MSALGSSVINKSGKKFAPKAPIRRPAAPDSVQTSARTSIDRQIVSRTPQPQSEQQPIVNSHPPAVSLPTPAPSQSAIVTTLASTSQDDTTTLISIPITRKSHFSHPQNASTKIPIPANPRKRTAKPVDATLTHAPDSEATSQTVTPASGKPDDAAAVEVVAPENPITPSITPSVSTTTNSAAFAGNSTIAVRPTEGLQDNANPPVKRRRIEKPQQNQRSVPSISANIPRPTIETDVPVLGLPNTLAQGRVSSQLKQQPVRKSKPRISAKARGKQRADVPPALTPTDATQTVAGPAGAGNQAPEVRPPRASAKRNGRQAAEEAAAEIVADAVQGTARKRKGTYTRRRRSPTPDEAATETISSSTMKMAELCKDTRKGKKSKREAELQAMEEAEYVKKKQKEVQALVAAEEPEAPVPDAQETADQRLERLAQANQTDRAVPQLIIIDNEIMIDQSTLQIDRHANAAAERNAEQLESVDETDLSRRVNAATFRNVDRSGSWDEEQTNLFYDGLRMFGTDFQTISKMFPGRSRRNIKLKFCKEEKVDYQHIKTVLMGERTPVDIDEFSKITNTVFDDPKELEREMEEDRKALERDMAAEKEVMQEAVRKRAEEARMEGEAVTEEASGKENEGSGRKSKKRGKGEKPERKGRGKRGKEAGPGAEAMELGPIEEGPDQGVVEVAA